jgi:riboflavin synthase
MFSGIIETIGKLKSVVQEEGNLRLCIESELTPHLKIDQSIAHNGICLTVVAIAESTFEVVAIDETINKTTLGNWSADAAINLERCIALGGRVDGHMVQGHVDTTGEVISIANQDGSWKYVIQYDSDDLTVPKGSVAVNGVSLTVVDSEPRMFSICIIPYTYAHTTFQHLKEGDRVNLEFDIIGKYVARYMRHIQK